MIELNRIRETAEQLARAGGALALARWDEPLNAHLKGYRDVVTDIDVAVQTLIVDGVRTQFPTHGFITEEDTTDDAPAAVTWIIDPIDGTSNYSRHISNWCVSIGVAVNGKMAVGVVFDPVRDELFAAVTGQGATLNGQPIRVRDTRKADDSVISFDWSRGHDARVQLHKSLRYLKEHARNVRSFGSATLATVWIAAGRTEAYFNLMISIWDVAAASLIVQEAGGKTSSFDGVPFHIDKPETYQLSSNGRIHAELLRLIASAN